MTVFANRVYVVTATTGTGTVTPGAAFSNAWASFSEAGVPDGATVTYVLEEGNDFEIGSGVYNTAGPTLTRATVFLSKIAGTIGTTKMTLGGAATIKIIVAKEDMLTRPAASNDNALLRFNGVLGDIQGQSTVVFYLDDTGRIIGGNPTSIAVGPTVGQFQLHGLTDDTSSNSGTRWSADAGAARFAFGKSRGATVGDYTIVNNDDPLGQIIFHGADGTAFRQSSMIQGRVEGAPAAGSMAGRIDFLTSKVGSVSPDPRVRIMPTGYTIIVADPSGAMVSPDRAFHAEESTGNTTTVQYVKRLTHKTTATADVGFGVGEEHEMESGSGNMRVASAIETVWIDATNASEDAVINAKRMAAGALQESFGLDFLSRALTANVAYTNNSSAQQWFASNGALLVEGSTSYEFDGNLLLTVGSTTHTLALSFAGTATLTSIGYHAEAAAAAINVNSASTVVSHTMVNQAASTVVMATSTLLGNMARVRGVVRINAAGTFIPQFTFSAGPGAGNVLANTFFKMRKFGSNTNAFQGTWS